MGGLAARLAGCSETEKGIQLSRLAKTKQEKKGRACPVRL